MEIFALIVFLISPLQLADSLFYEGDYFHAITEYKRAVYLNDSVQYALFRIGLSYERRGKYDFAAKYFGDLAIDVSTPEVIHHLAFNLVKMKRYREALLVLQDEKDSVSLLLYAITKGLMGHFHEADSGLIDLGYRPLEVPSISLVRYPSYFIPGAGLFILGEKKRAFLSLLFTTAAGYLSYYLIKQKRYPEAALAFNTLFLRFYFGNIENALKIRRKIKNNFYMSLLDRLNH